jgi:hypothetical protein
MPLTAQILSTAEAAFDEYQQAWVQKDIPRFLATICFRQEAYELVQRSGHSGAEPSESAVSEVAAKRESELRTLLETRGFIATDIGNCNIAQKVQIAEDQVRFILSCRSSTSALLLPIRLMRFPIGWLVVRGG